MWIISTHSSRNSTQISNDTIIRKAGHQIIYAFQLEKTLESPLGNKTIKPVKPKGNQPWIFFGRTNAKVEYLATWWKSWLTGKDPDAGKDWAQEQKQAAVNEMVGWHHDSHQTHGRELEQTPGDNEGQGSLVSCSS